MANVGCRIAVVVILCYALAFCADAKPKRARPVLRKDHHRRASNDLEPGELIANVLNFGAVADGKTDSSQAFLNAWEKVCHSKTRTRFLVPPGNFTVGQIRFAGDQCEGPTPFRIQVEGHVLALSDEYVKDDWFMFDCINNLRIIGKGTFDGQGNNDYWKKKDRKINPHTKRAPASLLLNNVTNAYMETIRSVNPKGFHIFVTNSAGVTLKKLKMIAPENSTNTDGIHISHSIKIRIDKCTIKTGDDCISMIQGVNNVWVNKMNCGPGHGISIGSLGKYEDELAVKGVLVQNSKLKETTNGVRIKAWPEKFPGYAANITFVNITMAYVKHPIILDQEYECKPNCNKKPSLVQISDITFQNIRGTTTSKIPVVLKCSGKYPCRNIRLTDIDLRYGGFFTSAQCQNVKPIYAGSIFPPPCV